MEDGCGHAGILSVTLGLGAEYPAIAAFSSRKQ
jgi:hypothetical protein